MTIIIPDSAAVIALEQALAADDTEPGALLDLVKGLDNAARPEHIQRFFIPVLVAICKCTVKGETRQPLLNEIKDAFGVLKEHFEPAVARADYEVAHPEPFQQLDQALTAEPLDLAGIKRTLEPLCRVINQHPTAKYRHLREGLEQYLRAWLRQMRRPGAEPDDETLILQVRAAVAAAGPAPMDPAEVEALRAELRVQAKPVLEAEDPLVLVEQAFRKLGYGGDTDPAMIVFLAMTTRLLVMRQGSMPSHLLLVGVPGAGKSYTMQVNLALLPRDAWHAIDAGSPKVLIYDPQPIHHKVLVFSEADSLPAGEDNPAASAIRALLQDHELHYDVVVRDAETGAYVIQTIRKPGPTMLATTAIRRLGPQLDSRLFVLEVPEDRKRVKEALMMRARVETHGGVEGPDAAVVAYQALLALDGPHDVQVPFAEGIARAVAEGSAGPRILRDFERLLSLIKAAAVQRLYRRERAADGRVTATLDDYRAVYQRVGAMYEGTTGATKEVRQVVAAVAELARQTPPRNVTGADVTRHLGGTYKMAVSRHIQAALKAGWLMNLSTNYRQALVPGDDLPEVDGLPTPEQLRRTPMR